MTRNWVAPGGGCAVACLLVFANRAWFIAATFRRSRASPGAGAPRRKAAHALIDLSLAPVPSGQFKPNTPLRPQEGCWRALAWTRLGTAAGCAGADHTQEARW